MENCIRKLSVHSFTPQKTCWVSITCQACCWVLGSQQQRRHGPLHWTITLEATFPSPWQSVKLGALSACSPSQAYTVPLWKLKKKKKCALFLGRHNPWAEILGSDAWAEFQLPSTWLSTFHQNPNYTMTLCNGPGAQGYGGKLAGSFPWHNWECSVRAGHRTGSQQNLDF